MAATENSMTDRQPAPLSQLALRVTGIVVVSSLALSAFLFIRTGVTIFEWLTGIMAIEVAIGMKCAAPRLPAAQSLALIVAIVSTLAICQFLAFNVSPLFLFAGKVVVPFLCVWVFGRYWVKKGYIPKWANRW